MLSLYKKVFSTQGSVIPLNEVMNSPSTLRMGTPLAENTRRLFRGSLAIREVDAGSTAAEEEELKALSNAYYDCDRFGIHFVASPRHADMLAVTGPVTRNMAEALRRTYNATPDPKIIVAVGDGAIDGGIFKDSYAIVGGVDKVIPVHFYIPGNPPTPTAILRALLEITEIIRTPKPNI
jgi:Ni,Fe-hydrogenase III small subunit